jgi:GntR family transcriptional regulator
MSIYSSKVPITYQLAQLLRAEIRRGACPPGSRLPTEVQLASQHGVSVITVQRALRELEQEGLIERFRGRGTFVRDVLPTAVAVDPHLVLDLMFSDEFEAGTKVLSKKLVDTPEHLRARFKVDQLYEICRITPQGGLPLSYSTHYVLPEHGKNMTLASLRKYPLFRILREQHRLSMRNVEISLEAVAPPLHIARLLKIDPVSPLLLFSGALFDIDGRLVHLPQIWYRGDRFQFRFDMDLTHEPTDRPGRVRAVDASAQGSGNDVQPPEPHLGARSASPAGAARRKR